LSDPATERFRDFGFEDTGIDITHDDKMQAARSIVGGMESPNIREFRFLKTKDQFFSRGIVVRMIYGKDGSGEGDSRLCVCILKRLLDLAGQTLLYFGKFG
jgi:hypothetical protein